MTLTLSAQEVADLRGLLESELPPIASPPDDDFERGLQARCAALLARLDG